MHYILIALHYIIANIVSFSFRKNLPVREPLMNISHFHAARGRRGVSILHRCRYAVLLQLAAVTFSHTCSPLHLPMIREAFVVPIRAFHHYVSSIALRDERRNMLVKLQSLGRYVGHENGTHPRPLPQRDGMQRAIRAIYNNKWYLKYIIRINIHAIYKRAGYRSPDRSRNLPPVPKYNHFIWCVIILRALLAHYAIITKVRAGRVQRPGWLSTDR